MAWIPNKGCTRTTARSLHFTEPYVLNMGLPSLMLMVALVSQGTLFHASSRISWRPKGQQSNFKKGAICIFIYVYTIIYMFMPSQKLKAAYPASELLQPLREPKPGLCPALQRNSHGHGRLLPGLAVDLAVNLKGHPVLEYPPLTGPTLVWRNVLPPGRA